MEAANLTTRDSEALEAMIDRYGILAIVRGLADIASLKSEHVSSAWQDHGLAKAWGRVASSLSRIAVDNWGGL